MERQPNLLHSPPKNAGQYLLHPLAHLQNAAQIVSLSSQREASREGKRSLSPSPRSEQYGGRGQSNACADPSPPKTRLYFPTTLLRLAVERAVGTMISSHRFPQIVGPLRILWFRCLLRGESSFAEIAIEPTRCDLIADDRLDCRPTSINLTPRVMRCPVKSLAPTSGWKIGGTGCALFFKRLFTQPNCGVFRADIWTIVIRTLLLSWISSQRNESVNPAIACWRHSTRTAEGCFDRPARIRPEQSCHDSSVACVSRLRECRTPPRGKSRR